MALSLHIIPDNAEDVWLDRALLDLKRTNQRHVQIGGGSQMDRAHDFVRRVRREMPNIKIFWRDLQPEDTGILSEMTAEELFARKVKPHLKFLQENRLIFMPDNESSGSNDWLKKTYVPRVVKFGELLHSVHLNGAFCRFATGNIYDAHGDRGSQDWQYQYLKPIFNMMQPGDYVSPNEYSDVPPRSSGGNLARYKELWIAAGRKLPTVIGEAGIAYMYNPGWGFRYVKMQEHVFAQQMIDEEIWYRDNGEEVDRLLYVVGAHGWEHFQLIQTVEQNGVRVGASGVLDYLENYYQKHPVPVYSEPMQPPPPPEESEPMQPPPPSEEEEAASTVPANPYIAFANPVSDYVNLRTGPGTEYKVLTQIDPNELVIVYRKNHTKVGSDNKMWRWVNVFGIWKGWARADLLRPIEATEKVLTEKFK